MQRRTLKSQGDGGTSQELSATSDKVEKPLEDDWISLRQFRALMSGKVKDDTKGSNHFMDVKQQQQQRHCWIRANRDRWNGRFP